MLHVKPAPEYGLDFSASPSCSNDSCSKLGEKACAGCYLVLYCSRECQTSHWKKHKAECNSKLMKASWRPSWETEKRSPAFVYNATSPAESMRTYGKQKFLWGNVPAFDVLNLEQNEGVAYSRDIRLLFAASGDLRHVVKTVVGISPCSASQSFDVIINDRDFDIVARNAILLLAALHADSSPGGIAATADAMLHTWYSARIPTSVLHRLRATVLPLVRGVCDKIADKPADRLLAKTWVRGSRSLRLVLEKRRWDALPTYLELPDGLTVEEAGRVRTAAVLSEERRDYLERALCCQPPGWRAATMRFRQDGVLLPFGASRKAFDAPNPTFFQERDVWPMMDSADPLEGWRLEDILRKTPLAKNDLYGGLFFYVRELLVDFCSKIQELKISLVLLHVDAVELPKTLANDFGLMDSFDRIEIANIADRGYLGLKCLYIFAPLLRPIDENPHATLVTLFLNAIGEVETEADTLQTMKREMRRIADFLSPTTLLAGRMNGDANADSIRFMSALSLFRDFDSLFARYMRDCYFDAIARDAGLRPKPKHTIIESWPLRLGKRATRSEFEKLLGSGHCGHEKYVEWKRAV